MKQALVCVVKNTFFWLELALFGLLLLHNMASGTVAYYFCNSVVGNANLVGTLNSIYSVAALVMNIFVCEFVKRLGKRRVLINGAIAISITSALMGVFSTSIPALIVLIAIKGFFAGSMFSCAFSLTGDVVDYGEWKNGVRSEGLINAGFSLGQKTGMGFGPAIATWILSAGGYDGLAAVQSASAKAAITFSYTWLLAIIGVLILAAALFFNIDKYSAKMQADLLAKHSAK